MSGLCSKENYGRYVSKVWVADNGDGTYKNPIIFADYSDPDVIRVGKDYYMTASSFNCVPGLPVLHSRDLVNWEIAGYALPKLYPEQRYNVPQHSKGVWAPCMRFRDGCFYIYWGDPDLGIYMVRSKEPHRGWEYPVQVLAGKGLIDPSPFWDNDGNAYLVHAWAGSRAGFNSVLTLRRMDPEGTKILDKGRHIFDGNDDYNYHTIEGPKFYKRDGYYYIFAPAGGVTNGWQVVLRSKKIYGPYEAKIVLSQGSTNINGPHQGGWVDTEKGEDWFIHFQDKGAYGRILHLQPMKWVDGWCVIGDDSDGDGKGEPVGTFKKPDLGREYPVVTPAESDEFESDTLGLQWQWQANPKSNWYSLMKEMRFLRLFGIRLSSKNAGLRDAGNLLLQKFPAPDFTAVTRMRFQPVSEADKAGLVVMGDEYTYLSVSQSGGQVLLSQIIGEKADEGCREEAIEQILIPSGEVSLHLEVKSPDAQCRFGYSLDGKEFKAVGKSFTPGVDGWTGVKAGIFCVSDFESDKSGGYADFDWFRIE